MRFAPFLSLLLAFALTALAVPDAVAPYKPNWIAVTLIFWALAAPPACGLVTALVVGLALDALTGALLGQHALGLLIVVYLSGRFRLRLRAFPVSQSTLAVAGLLALNEFVLLWIDGIVGRSVPLGERWPPIVTGTLLWLLIWSTVDHGREQASAGL